ncbi:MAG: glycosyltransferase family 2 protein [Planctomycetota bacterium]|jgi:glycosyltransferase involved in cell wall biosynthesis
MTAAPTSTATTVEDALVRPGAEPAPTVSICVPHYQVQDLMRLCLRALRRYTDGPRYEVIVVDNGSTDESLDWLRSMEWITLVERGESTPDNWIRAMNTALDIGLQRARGDYYLIMHSDTIVKRRGWLRRMVEAIESGPQVASCGSGKLEQRGAFAQFVRDATDTKRLRLWLRRTILRDAGARQLTREPCPRDYCAMYRTAALREHGLSFVSKGGYSAGETVYYDLKHHGYESSVIPVPEMMRNMDHIAHATGAIRPERKLDRAHTFRKTRRRLKKLFHRDDVDALLADDSLER